MLLSQRLMCKRILCCFLISFGFASGSIAQQQGAPVQDLELNLDQFPDAPVLQQNTTQQNDELKLNLEQFDKPEATDAPDTDRNLELNLEQFDTGNDSTHEISTADPDINSTDNPGSPKKSYRHVLIVGGLVLMFFLYSLSKRRRRGR